MRKLKKTISKVIMTAMLVSLCACQSTDKGEVTTAGEEISTGTVEEISTGTEEPGKTEEDIKTVNKKEYLAQNLLDDVKQGEVVKREVDDAFVASATEFYLNIFKTSVKSDVAAGKNVMISPESVITCLALAANGADGETLKEMETVICPGLSMQDLNEYLFSYNDGREDNEDVIFNNANSIWIRNDEDRIKINDGYLGKIKTYYDAAVFKADFSKQTADDINAWVNRETNEMIDGIIAGKIPDEIVMYLINAIAFEGKWTTEYKDFQILEKQVFTDSEGNTQNVTMLDSMEGFYMRDENSSAFLKYYKGNEYAFMGILPDKGVDVADYIGSLDAEKFMNLYEDRTNHNNTDVHAVIPEFKYDYASELSASLMSLGMQKAFTENADFSGMAGTKTGMLFISRVLHKTHIELDRNGTKAAAVTVIETTDTADVMPQEIVEIKLDRPFVYAIVDTNTGLPVFIGAVNSIE